MSNLSDLQKLILWCRKNGIAWGALECGTLRIDGADTRLTGEMPPAKPDQPRRSIYDQYGEGLLREQIDGAGESAVTEIDD